ncbi:MAG: PmoA family protein [Planctomycetaceae bacterium]|nr:PmoA family protein [Planctomycetaceae bacterium]
MPSLSCLAWSIFAASLFSLTVADLCHAKDYPLTVTGGESTIVECPVSIELPKGIGANEHLSLKRPGQENGILIQRDGSDRAIFILDEPLGARESRDYVLGTFAGKVDEATFVECHQQDDVLRVTSHGREVFTYHIGISEPPVGVDKLFRRSGHIHPVKTPSGKVVTEEFPADHLHQHAIFSAWVKTEFEGRPVDFWNQHKGQGTVRHAKLISSESGTVFAEFTVALEHVDLSAPEGPKVALNETWNVRVYGTPSGHLFDLKSTQRTASDSPLSVQEYHYGGMAARGAGEWLGQPEANFLTSEGKNRVDGNHSRPDWVSMHGLVDGVPCGLAVFSSPRNFRSPQPVRLHPSKPYFVFSPCVLGDFQIAPGEEAVSEYRYFAYDGPPDLNRLDQIFHGYTSTIDVTLDE